MKRIIVADIRNLKHSTWKIPHKYEDYRGAGQANGSSNIWSRNNGTTLPIFYPLCALIHTKLVCQGTRLVEYVLYKFPNKSNEIFRIFISNTTHTQTYAILRCEWPSQRLYLPTKNSNRTHIDTWMRQPSLSSHEQSQAEILSRISRTRLRIHSGIAMCAIDDMSYSIFLYIQSSMRLNCMCTFFFRPLARVWSTMAWRLSCQCG